MFEITFSQNYDARADETTMRNELAADLTRANAVPVPGSFRVEVVTLSEMRITDAIDKTSHRYLRASMDGEKN